MQSLRDGPHDDVLNLGPVAHDLGVSDPDDVKPHEHQSRVVLDVLRALSADVMPAIDLQMGGDRRCGGRKDPDPPSLSPISSATQSMNVDNRPRVNED